MVLIPNIIVDDLVRERLKDLKNRFGSKSYSDTINLLIHQYDYLELLKQNQKLILKQNKDIASIEKLMLELKDLKLQELRELKIRNKKEE